MPPVRPCWISCRWSAAVILSIAAFGASACQRTPTSDNSTATPQAKPYPMRVLVVDDPALAAVLERLWRARIENELQLEQLTVAELAAAKQLTADIVIYPSTCLGELAERGLIATPSAEALEDPRYGSRDVFELQRRIEGRWGDQLYAFSLGSPQLVLMYRADLFTALGLAPPQTWSAYQELAAQLTREQLGAGTPPADQPWYPVIEPQADGWGAKTLLARAAAYASHPSQFSALFDYETMRPLIAGPPFVRALEELVAAQTGSDNHAGFTPETARRALLAGQAGMVLTWPSRATTDEVPTPLADGVRVAFAELPGATTVYNFAERTWTSRDAEGVPMQVPLLGVAGRLASVGQRARRPLEAARIIAILGGREWSAQLSPASPATTLFRQSHMQNPELWTDENLPREASEQYAQIVQESQSRSSVMVCLRIPGWERYLAALDRAVQEAGAGIQSPADALAGAAETWDAINQELGIEAQQEAYTRSLGLEP